MGEDSGDVAGLLADAVPGVVRVALDSEELDLCSGDSNQNK